jgi:hypothetical protein
MDFNEQIIVKHNFYEEYNSLILDIILVKRMNHISEKYLGNKRTDNFLSDYFVDIFSWSVFPFNLLKEIEKILINNKITTLLDLSCGNAFHMFLFKNFTKIKTYAIDIQNEENSWHKIIVEDGRKYISNIIDFTGTGLFLSWIDYDELALELLQKYKGNLVISVGNYELRSKKYLNYLHRNYKLIKKYILHMPWDRTEKIEIYTR